MLVEKAESVNREVRECELRCQDSVASIVEVVLLVLSRECGPRDRERWNRGDESCKLTI